LGAAVLGVLDRFAGLGGEDAALSSGTAALAVVRSSARGAGASARGAPSGPEAPRRVAPSPSGGDGNVSRSAVQASCPVVCAAASATAACAIAGVEQADASAGSVTAWRRNSPCRAPDRPVSYGVQTHAWRACGHWISYCCWDDGCGYRVEGGRCWLLAEGLSKFQLRL
jgi:hypothetical protein